ncbi:hypothetical protein CVS30_12550 [Arthrobacter psychrolactophilus]|uniref:GAP family protein n=1 Tax=Arthrobacter psychrolactophilus TaxID=92442 RepID=A0A2V5IVB2_9MICC|nr:GAP family protein [Arthrobacter psychrolactophilus]PYI38043.1 hypothetical protein CVS30_12550 [Arthrobacter psychrolactophilus]
MNGALGDILPFAATIAISPVPIIAIILMLMSARPKPMGLGFLAGWVAGIAIAVSIFVLLAGAVSGSEEDAGSQPVLGAVQLLFGLVLLALAVKQWRSRPKPGEVAELPKWMAAIDTMKPAAALGLAFLLAAVNPKNLLMAAAAGVSIGHGGLQGGTMVLLVVLFTVISSLSILAPVAIFLVAPGKAASILEKVRSWLTANNATIMMVLLLILGMQLLGKGIASF